MAAYKVPQDVEAEDKLIGWLSFRQFIYLGIAAMAAVVAFFLFQTFPALVIIPLPIIFLFGALALPIRKDQPLETYLLAVARFYLKPKTRRWDPEGVISYVEITAPTLAEPHLAKEYGAESAQERLDYLARIMDSRGWSYKGVTPQNASVTPAVAAEANNTVDVMDDQANISKSFDNLLERQKGEQRQKVIENMQRAQTSPPAQQSANNDYEDKVTTTFNPYPKSMHQKVVLPIEEQKKRAALKAKIKPAAPPVSPVLAQLATNKDLSVSAIAHEAHRLEKKEGEEVIIQLH